MKFASDITKPQFSTNQHTRTHPKKKPSWKHEHHCEVTRNIVTSSSPVNPPFLKNFQFMCITNQSNSNKHTSTTFNHIMDVLVTFLSPFCWGGVWRKDICSKKTLVIWCVSLPLPPPKQQLLPWPKKKHNDATRGDRSGVAQAIHSDPDDGELVSVVKEALANLDHALLERNFFGG